MITDKLVVCDDWKNSDVRMIKHKIQVCQKRVSYHRRKAIDWDCKVSSLKALLEQGRGGY